MISVGNHAVWAISRDKTVWFRNGIHGQGSGESEALARGVKWVGMVGGMTMISLGPLDQVVAIQDDSERSIVIRTGVNSSDLSGKTWKIISAGFSNENETQLENLRPNLEVIKNMATREMSEEPPKGASGSSAPESKVTHGINNEAFKKTANKIGDKTAKEITARIATGAIGATVGRIPFAGPIVTSVTAGVIRDELNKVKIIDDDQKEPEKKEENPEKVPEIEESMYKSALEHHHHEDDKVSVNDDKISMTSENAMFDREDIYGDDTFDSSSCPQWTWLTLGTCKLDPGHLPSPWFVDSVAASQNLSNEAWRLKIVEVSCQNTRNGHFMLDIEGYALKMCFVYFLNSQHSAIKPKMTVRK